MSNVAVSAVKKPSVVILDDEPQLLHLLELGVRDWFKDPEVFGFANGDEAWAEISRHEPDLLIMDWSHPGLDGHALLEKLAAKPAGFVILLTSELFADQMNDLMGKGLKIGYLPKPFGMQQLWRALNEFIGPSDFPEHQAYLSHPDLR
jgi:DNA-binding response OmpR family regulator